MDYYYANHYLDKVPKSSIGHLVSFRCVDQYACNDHDDIWEIVRVDVWGRKLVHVKLIRGHRIIGVPERYPTDCNRVVDTSEIYYRTKDNIKKFISKEQIEMFNTC